MCLNNIKFQSVLWSLLLVVISNLSFIQTSSPDNEQLAFVYSTNDKVLLNIYEIQDENGLLTGYTSHVLTPVCEDRICFNAEVYIRWDLLGNFIRFNPVAENPLTKLNHIPFAPSDYDKLKDILLDQSPSFIHLKRSELIYEDTNESEDVDGISSATVAEVKNDMVEGAIYTCYTLWYIANGGINFNIREHTSKRLSDELIIEMTMSGNIENHLFLTENIDSSKFELFFDEISSFRSKYDSFFLQRLVEKMPDQLFVKPKAHNFFIRRYNNLEYSSKNLVLKKLQKIPLEKSALELLVANLQPDHSDQNDKIIKLICENIDANTTSILSKTFDVLQNRKITTSHESKSLMILRGQEFEFFKKVVKRFQKQNNL